MENKNNRTRRVPGASAKRTPQKAPHAMPRKHAPVTEEPINKAPEVVYLPPKPFNRQRFLLHLASIIAVVLALMLGLSIFFKVDKIQVAGCDRYTAWQVQEASGIKTGDQLLTFSRGRAAGRIQDQLPYIKRVRIGISLPDTVHIEVVETRVTYALQDTAGNWWLMDSDGKIVDQAPDGVGKLDVTVSGVILEDPQVGQQAKAYQPEQTATDASGVPVPITVTAAQKLAAGKTIAAYLEANGIIGDVVSIDLENIFEISMWYKDQYRILLGDTDRISLKISCLKAFLADYNENRPYEAGKLDLSDPEHIKYQSFTE